MDNYNPNSNIPNQPYDQANNPYIPNQANNPNMSNQVNNPYMPNQANNPYMPNQVNDPYMMNGPQMQQPVNKRSDMTPEDAHNANMLCIISLVCHFAVPVLVSFFTSIISGVNGAGDISNASNAAIRLFTSISGISVLASWVLMIIVRVKYKESTFGKVVMWIYIGLLILSIVAIIILVIACVGLIKECQGCPG